MSESSDTPTDPRLVVLVEWANGQAVCDGQFNFDGLTAHETGVLAGAAINYAEQFAHKLSCHVRETLGQEAANQLVQGIIDGRHGRSSTTRESFKAQAQTEGDEA